MGTDREARILAAGEIVEVNGEEYRLRPATAQNLCDLEREALRYHKRQYLETFKDNADLMGDNGQAVREEISRVARWSLRDLPQVDAFDASLVPVTEDVNKWVKSFYSEIPDTEDGVRALLVMALDMGDLSPEAVKEMAGRAPIRGRVRYDQWWVTASMEGMVSFISMSIRKEHPKLKKDDIAGWSVAKVAEAVRKVEALTAASMGNT